MKLKLYKNQRWLTKRYQQDRMDISEIAEECGVTQQTIYVHLRQFGLI